LAPAPAIGEIRDDIVEPVLLFVLVEQNEVVEDGHHWRHHGNGALFVDRHIGGAVAVKNTQRAAGLLRQCGARKSCQNHRGERGAYQTSHRPLPQSLRSGEADHRNDADSSARGATLPRVGADRTAQRASRALRAERSEWAYATCRMIGPSSSVVARRKSRGAISSCGRPRCIVQRLSQMTRSPTAHW